ncbi:MAG TPA: hypothetical protein VK742_06585, partial [Candidatus Sulfotelmatobacter sp.]|nr:hypothetical protein [Candidatus Sulfotelmatobacter sp.]
PSPFSVSPTRSLSPTLQSSMFTGVLNRTVVVRFVISTPITFDLSTQFSPNSEVDSGFEKHRCKPIVVGRVSPLRAAPATGWYKLSPVSLSQPVENNGILQIPSFQLLSSGLV